MSAAGRIASERRNTPSAIAPYENRHEISGRAKAVGRVKAAGRTRRMASAANRNEIAQP
jgi:hypothetical protein